MKQTRLCSIALVLCAGAVFLTLTGFAQAQQIDVALGMNKTDAPPASKATGDHSLQQLANGIYPSISGDILLYKRFGVQAEVAWKGSKGEWGGYQPYRPLFYDVNAIWVPKIFHRTYAEMLVGLGEQSTHFYTGTTCSYVTCTNYSSSNHFMGHLGGGIKMYAKGNFFIRPEAHLYLVHNNFEFSAMHAVRYGASIGYTFK